MGDINDKSQELVNKIEHNDTKSFLAQWQSIPWNERSQYASTMNRFSDHDVANDPSLPHIHVETKTMKDIAGVQHDYVSRIQEDEARAFYNPFRYIDGPRSESTIYSPTLSERIKNGVTDRVLPLQDMP
jgi:hypothetical protein